MSGLAYAKATGDYEAAQADIEHGFYGAFGSANPSVQMTAPGCNNGGNNCTNGNHGYAWTLEQRRRLRASLGQLPEQLRLHQCAVEPRAIPCSSQTGRGPTRSMRRTTRPSSICTAKAGDVVDLTAGGRYQRREVDYVHGRYLENGVNPYGIGGVGAGTAAGNCCISTVPGQSGT